MKLRVSFTVSLTRDNAASESASVMEHQGSQVENAGRQPIGFVIPPTNHQDPFEGEDKM